MSYIEKAFERLASRMSHLLGHGVAFVIAFMTVVVGLTFFPTEIVNVAISVVTLLAIFLLQNSQNKPDVAMHLKLDELLTKLDPPRSKLAGVEEGTMEHLTHEKQELRDSTDENA